MVEKNSRQVAAILSIVEKLKSLPGYLHTLG